MSFSVAWKKSFHTSNGTFHFLITHWSLLFSSHLTLIFISSIGDGLVWKLHLNQLTDFYFLVPTLRRDEMRGKVFYLSTFFLLEMKQKSRMKVTCGIHLHQKGDHYVNECTLRRAINLFLWHMNNCATIEFFSVWFVVCWKQYRKILLKWNLRNLVNWIK